MSPADQRKVITNVIDFLEKIRKSADGMAHIRFKKKDGTMRNMICTLDFDRIPQWDKPKKVDVPAMLKMAHKHGLLRVYDTEKRGWRSVSFDTAEWLEVKDEETNDTIRYSIKS